MLIYSDESYCKDQRFYTITGISGEEKILKLADLQIQNILNRYGISEMKYSKIKSLNKYLAPFKEIINFLCPLLKSGKIRINSICWDRLDSRRQVIGINHERDFERMYYFLLRIIVKNIVIRNYYEHVMLMRENNVVEKL